MGLKKTILYGLFSRESERGGSQCVVVCCSVLQCVCVRTRAHVGQHHDSAPSALFKARHTSTHYRTLQHTVAHCSTLQHTAAHCSTLQHTATHCNTLQHTAPQYIEADCNTLHLNILHCTATRDPPPYTHKKLSCTPHIHTAHTHTHTHLHAPTRTHKSAPSNAHTHTVCSRSTLHFHSSHYCCCEYRAQHPRRFSQCNTVQHTATHCNALQQSSPACCSLTFFER